MKKLLIGLLALGSISVLAGDIVNKRTGDRLTARCESYDEFNQNCQDYSIFLEESGQEVFLTKYHVRTIDNPEEQFLLSEELKKLKYFPVTSAVFGRNNSVADYRPSGSLHFVEHEDGIIDKNELLILAPAAITGATVVSFLPAAAGLPVVLTAMVGASAGMIALPFAAPPILDIVSLPVRALVKGIQKVKAKKSEIRALGMLSALTYTTESINELSNSKFKSLVKTLKTIKN